MTTIPITSATSSGVAHAGLMCGDVIYVVARSLSNGDYPSDIDISCAFSSKDDAEAYASSRLQSQERANAVAQSYNTLIGDYQSEEYQRLTKGQTIPETPDIVALSFSAAKARLATEMHEATRQMPRGWEMSDWRLRFTGEGDDNGWEVHEVTLMGSL